MFNYPVREGRHDFNFNFNGYVNNITDGYTDGINPIAALKYGHAVVEKVPNPETGAADRVFQSNTSDGPTYEQRNRIGPPKWSGDRMDWEMRELIVRKGLPRASVRRPFPWGRFHHKQPDIEQGADGRFWRWRSVTSLAKIRELRLEFRGENLRVADALPGFLDAGTMPRCMLSPTDFGGAPNLHFPEHHRIKEILITGDEPDFEKLKQHLDSLIDIQHRAVADMFSQPDTFLALLETNQAIRNRFARNLDHGRRYMRWLVDGGDRKSPPIDEWHGAEPKLARKWVGRFEGNETDTAHEDNQDGQGETEIDVTPRFENYIRQMFREIDIKKMAFLIKLDDYEDVKN